MSVTCRSGTSTPVYPTENSGAGTRNVGYPSKWNLYDGKTGERPLLFFESLKGFFEDEIHDLNMKGDFS